MKTNLKEYRELADEIQHEGRQIRVIWRPAEFDPPLI
jgi:hypothetical protein